MIWAIFPTDNSKIQKLLNNNNYFPTQFTNDIKKKLQTNKWLPSGFFVYLYLLFAWKIEPS